MMRPAWLFLILLSLCAVTRGDTSTLVGRGVDVRDVLIPGPELHVKKSRGLADPLMLRITATYPHGTLGFRYDLHCVPMIAGKHDLSHYLETAGGEPAKGAPAIIVEATGVLPAGPPGELEKAPMPPLPMVGGYEKKIPYGVGLWLAAGLGGVWYFRKRKAQEALAAAPPTPTLAEQVKALLGRAIAQPLATTELAELERLLLGHGRQQLGLANATDPAVWSALRENPKTAAVMRALESWLHRPTTSPPSTAELQAMLARIP